MEGERDKRGLCECKVKGYLGGQTGGGERGKRAQESGVWLVFYTIECAKFLHLRLPNFFICVWPCLLNTTLV